jgi:hypothetical protein
LLAILSASTFNCFKEEFMVSGILQSLLEIVNDSKQQGSLYIRELCFNIIGNLCDDCRDNQKILRRLNGIETIRDNITLM